MKLKILTKIVELILNKTDPNDEPRADMYLPNFLLAFGTILCAIGAGIIIVFSLIFNVKLLIVGVGILLLGIAAIMCWKNQTIHILDENTFKYTTFLGNSYTYAFSDITAARRNNDSLTVFVGNKKVHIESMAVLSDELVEKINKSLRNKVFSEFNNLTTEELKSLPDEKMYKAVQMRTESKVLALGDDYDNIVKGLHSLSEKQRIFYCLDYYVYEIDDGGLQMFFTNAGRAMAPYISESLSAIGANEHKALYDKCIFENCIDVNNPPSNPAQNLFNEFDEQFFRLDSLNNSLLNFIKENIEEF